MLPSRLGRGYIGDRRIWFRGAGGCRGRCPPPLGTRDLGVSDHWICFLGKGDSRHILFRPWCYALDAMLRTQSISCLFTWKMFLTALGLCFQQFCLQCRDDPLLWRLRELMLEIVLESTGEKMKRKKTKEKGLHEIQNDWRILFSRTRSVNLWQVFWLSFFVNNCCGSHIWVPFGFSTLEHYGLSEKGIHVDLLMFM